MSLALVWRADLAAVAVAVGFLGYDYWEIFENSAALGILFLSGRLVYLFISFILGRSFRRGGGRGPVSASYCLVMGLFSGFCLLTLAAFFNIIYSHSTDARLITALAAASFGANAEMLYLMRKLDEEKRIRRENAVLQRQIASQMSAVQPLQSRYSRQRRLTHDFTDHLIAIKGMAGDRRAVENYADRLIRDSSDRINVVNSNNAALDTIINRKLAASEKGVSVRFEINDLSHIALRDKDAVVIIANALDNAVRAARQTEEKRIRVRIMDDADSTLIAVINSSPPVEFGRDGLPLGRPASAEHGWGLKNMKSVAEKYGGIMAREYKDGHFTLSVVINK